LVRVLADAAVDEIFRQTRPLGALWSPNRDSGFRNCRRVLEDHPVTLWGLGNIDPMLPPVHDVGLSVATLHASWLALACHQRSRARRRSEPVVGESARITLRRGIHRAPQESDKLLAPKGDR